MEHKRGTKDVNVHFHLLEPVNNIHIPTKKNGCCAYFIDRFYRASFPIQINGFAVVVAAVIAVTLATATAVFTAFTTFSDGILLAFFVGIQMNRFHFTSDELVAVHKNATNQ